MAASSSPLSNFLSFILPTKPPPQHKAPPPQLSLSAPHKDNKLTTTTTQYGQHGSVAQVEPEKSSLSSVICPSLAYANTLFFKSAYNVQVVVDDNEPEERLLNRFRREVMRAGVIQECKRRRFHENKQDEKKRKTREAAKRNRRRRPPPPRFSAQNRQETPPSSKKQDEDEDNWDLPEGDIPY
ncbi:30S ribosomal protein S21 [Morus notabilis]|uniref:30S ribosomal protein S21 n=1 Tax=Morus notabilis TaxID=981085 RepID=W9SIU2_9ROSA|nr:30S ribosomal protein S21, chloroplastic [Morus notabilis]EXC31328.1 30S ribosomal protein S21 [Morus notabilis]